MNAIDFYRAGHWCHTHHLPLLPRLIYFLTFLLFNSSVPAGCQIGKGSKCAYGGIGVVIHARCKIGCDVYIGQNTTLGGSFGSDVPTVGDNVWISPGARIIGAVKIGNNVIIGANALVNRDVPDNSIVAGVPARVIRTIPAGSLNALKGTLATQTINE